MTQSPYLRLKARYLLLWLIVSSVVGVLVASPPTLSASSPEPLKLGVLTWVMYVVLLVLTVPQAWRAGIRPGDLFGAPVSGSALGRLSVLAVPLVGMALACTYGVFAPLSLVWPEAVHYLLLEDVPVFYDIGPPYPALGNLAGASAVVIAAPVAEEWLFRGLLMRRWSAKWGITSGVVGSSLLFGVLHADIVGAFLFGVAMCALYERYRSLGPPIVVHAANNLLVTFMAVVSEHTGILEDSTTVEHFRGEWWMLVVGIVLAVPWLGWLRRVWKPIRNWRFEPPAEHAMMQPPG